MSPTDLDRNLQTYVQDRDPEALGRVFDLAATKLFQSALQLNRSAEEAEEVLQETFLFLIASPESYQPHRPALPFLLGVLQKKSLERSRRELRRRPQAPADASLPAPDQDENSIRNQELRQAVESLPEKDKSVLLSILDEGMKPAQIAARFGESPGAVRTRLHRALGQLRKALPAGFALPSALLFLEGTSLAAVKAEVVRAALSAPSVTGGVAASSVAAGTSTVVLKFAAVAAALILVVSLPFVIDRFGADQKTELRTINSTAETATLDDRNDRVIPNRSAEASAASPPTGASAGVESPQIADLPDQALGSAESTPGAIETAEIAFHYQQGWSFSLGSTVDREEDADLWFKTCAGGISSITFSAPAGLRPTGIKARSLNGEPVSTDCYLRAVAAFRADLDFAATLSCDSREPHEDVFLFRTRTGGFGVAAIIERKSAAGWTKNDVVLRYRLNHREPVFSTEDLPPMNEQGLAIDEQAFRRDLQRELEIADWEKRVAQVKILVTKTDQLAESLASLAEGGTVVGLQDRNQVQAIMADSEQKLGRSKNLGYVLSTYSFAHQTRDDVETTRNNWDFGFDSNGSGNLRVRMVTDDRSQIWDFGALPLADVGISVRPQQAGAERLPIKVGHCYLIHTLDRKSELTAKLKILDYRKGEYLIFSWLPCDLTTALQDLRDIPQTLLKNPVVRLQIRGGAGGGNPNRVFLDGSKNAYMRKIVDQPIQIDGTIDINEGSQAFIEGGLIPRGMTWVIETIDYRGSTKGDSNGPGEFVLQIGGEKIAAIKESTEPFRGRWTGRLVLKPGDEQRSFAEIANSSAAEVTIYGRFESQ